MKTKKKIFRLREVAARQGVSSSEMCKRVLHDLARTKGIRVINKGRQYRLAELCKVVGKPCRDLKMAFKTMQWDIRVGKDGTVYRLVPKGPSRTQKIVRKISPIKQLFTVETNE